MMASGEVGLLLSPKYKLILFTIGTKGFWLGYFYFYYYFHPSLVRTSNRIDYFPPSTSPCAIRQRGGGARHHLLMLSHANMRNVMGSSGQVQCSVVLVERRRSLTADRCCFFPSGLLHPRIRIRITIAIAKSSPFASAASLPSSLVVWSLFLFFDRRWWLSDDERGLPRCTTAPIMWCVVNAAKLEP
jgi:hypothetical protein